jgi:hypothetical protein
MYKIIKKFKELIFTLKKLGSIFLIFDKLLMIFKKFKSQNSILSFTSSFQYILYKRTVHKISILGKKFLIEQNLKLFLKLCGSLLYPPLEVLLRQT